MYLAILDINYQSLEGVFTICAILGSLVFGIKLIFQFIGGDLDIDADSTMGDLDVAESGHGFQILSLHGLSAFFMIFGLAGRALLLDSKTSNTVAVIGALLLGLFATWIIAKLFSMMARLQSAPRSSKESAIGAEATVYLKIPEGGIGKIRVTVSGHLKVMDAASEDGEGIPGDARVRVVAVREDGVFVVKA